MSRSRKNYYCPVFSRGENAFGECPVLVSPHTKTSTSRSPEEDPQDGQDTGDHGLSRQPGRTELFSLKKRWLRETSLLEKMETNMGVHKKERPVVTSCNRGSSN